MQTKIMMTLSAAVLAVLGIALTFLPEELAVYLGSEPGPVDVLLLQVTGALYLGFAMLNWMAKGSLIGGIYNRPICIANFTHFFIAGMGLLKFLFRYPEQPFMLWGLCAVYAGLAAWYGLTLFQHPLPAEQSKV
ncbi:hypothetical protein K3G39_01255 [Pontibacter sp. HSC-14F20]|uniref:hypothetical protein n=1 Tax=Pontibacter sp. HSC-14F20 TaxID=2864136 RepID=UPI001C730589|nr:hypothetical protein [Pontibacter sp. HSC-14F20]MBX0331857.1 hypothetical protein [Pontibacter sp. HSC-14F20]